MTKSDLSVAAQIPQYVPLIPRKWQMGLTVLAGAIVTATFIAAAIIVMKSSRGDKSGKIFAATGFSAYAAGTVGLTARHMLGLNRLMKQEKPADMSSHKTAKVSI